MPYAHALAPSNNFLPLKLALLEASSVPWLCKNFPYPRLYMCKSGVHAGALAGADWLVRTCWCLGWRSSSSSSSSLWNRTCCLWWRSSSLAAASLPPQCRDKQGVRGAPGGLFESDERRFDLLKKKQRTVTIFLFLFVFVLIWKGICIIQLSKS